MGAHEVVEFDGEFGAVETELSAMDGGDFLEDAAATEAFDDFEGESADDLARAGGVVDGVPFVDLRGGRHAAEDGVLLDEGDGEAEARGADGGEDSGAGAADDAEVGFVTNGDGAGGFVDMGHLISVRGRSAGLKREASEQSNHVIDKTHDFGVIRAWPRLSIAWGCWKRCCGRRC